MTRRLGSGLAALFLVVGCGGAAQDAPAKAPAAVAAPSVATTDASPPTTPVAAPKNLVLLARVHRPGASLETLDKLLRLPVSLRALIEDESEGALAHLELGGTIDLALALDPASPADDEPEFLFAASIPFRSVDAAVALFQKNGADVRATSAGHYRVEDADDDLYCNVLPTAGRAPARAICADSSAALRDLGPWMSRTLSLEAPEAAELTARFDAAPFRDKYGATLRNEVDKGLGELRQEIGGVGQALDPELLEAPSIAAREGLAFLEDFDHMTAHVVLDGTKMELRMGGKVGFRSSTSWFTQVLTSENAQRSAPPEAFWRMPKDADSAMWGRSGDPRHFVGIRRVVRKGIAQGLAFVPQVPEADRQAVLAMFDAIPAMRGTWATSSGVLPLVPGGAPKDKPEKTTPAQVVVEAKNLARNALPWSIASSEGDGQDMVRFLERTADVYGRGVALLKKQADEDVRSASPEMKKYMVDKRKELDRLPKAKLTKNPPGFPAGSLTLDLDVAFTSEDVWELAHPVKDWDKRVEHPKGAPARGNLAFRIAVVPDGARHLWGYSLDPDALKTRMLGAREGAKPETTIASRTDLGRLRSTSLGGGFLGYGRIVQQLASVDENDADTKKLLELVSKMPNQGRSPMFLILDGTAGSAPTMSVEVVLEKPWIDDLTSAIREAVAQELRGRNTTAAP